MANLPLVKILRAGCMFLYLLVAIFLITCIHAHWRGESGNEVSDLYIQYKIEEAKKNGFKYTEEEVRRSIYGRDESKHNFYIAIYYGIDRSCEYADPQPRPPCQMNDSDGWYNDGFILVLLYMAFGIYLGNLIYIIVASAMKVNDKAFFILPITCLIATVFIFAGLILFCFSWNLKYRRVVERNGYGDEIVKQWGKDNEMAITWLFGGFGCCVIALLLSSIAICLSGGAAFFGHKQEKNNNDKPAAVAVVEAVPANPTTTGPPPPAPAPPGLPPSSQQPSSDVNVQDTGNPKPTA